MAQSESISYNNLQAPLSEHERRPFNIVAAMDMDENRIIYLRKAMGLTQDEFTDAINGVLKTFGHPSVTRGAVGNWELGKGVAMRNLQALSELTGASIDWIANSRGEPPDVATLKRIGQNILGTAVLGVTGTGVFPETVPIWGQAAGSTLADGALLLFDQEPIASLPLLPGLVGLRGLYALEVTGDSMQPMFKPRDPVYVSPYSPVREDDPMIVIEHRSNNGNPTAFIKLMVADKTDRVVGRQLNPRQTLDFMKRPGLTVHKVLSMREALGYSGVNVDSQAPAAHRFRRGPRR